MAAGRWAVFALAVAVGAARAQAVDCSAELAYAPFAAMPVPSLAAWGTLVLAGVLGLVAARRLRGRGAGVVRALLPGLVLLAAGAGFVAHRAQAGNSDLSDPAGSTLAFDAVGPHAVTNASGVRLRIAHLSSSSGFDAANTCQPGQLLEPGASCQLVLGSCTDPNDPGTGGGGT